MVLKICRWTNNFSGFFQIYFAKCPSLPSPNEESEESKSDWSEEDRREEWDRWRNEWTYTYLPWMDAFPHSCRRWLFPSQKKRPPGESFHTWLMTQWKSPCRSHCCRRWSKWPKTNLFLHTRRQRRLQNTVCEAHLNKPVLFHTFHVATLEVMTPSENNCLRNHCNLHNTGHH